MLAPVEVGDGSVELLVGDGLLKERDTRDREAVGEACLEPFPENASGTRIPPAGSMNTT
ncbi:MAG: hypothetical protein QF670_12545 [Alphaproteobacteria bacterium]|nr:hypothetical protein [Alphaproteobacteria bacterium]